MLVDNEIQIQKDDVVCIKLSSGDEVIGKVVENLKTAFTLSKPRQMILTSNPDNPGQAYIAFAPYMVGISDTEKVNIYSSQIVTIMKASNDASSNYIKSTTGIEIPSTRLM